jgi:hypothetical protein
MSYKHVIAEVVEGGLGPHHSDPHNPPQDVMYLSNNTMVLIVGPLKDVNVRAFFIPAMKCGRRSCHNL